MFGADVGRRAEAVAASKSRECRELASPRPGGFPLLWRLAAETVTLGARRAPLPQEDYGLCVRHVYACLHVVLFFVHGNLPVYICVIGSLCIPACMPTTHTRIWYRQSFSPQERKQPKRLPRSHESSYLVVADSFFFGQLDVCMHACVCVFFSQLEDVHAMLNNVSAERDAALSDARKAEARQDLSEDGETSGGAGTQEEVRRLRRDCDKLRDQVS